MFHGAKGRLGLEPTAPVPASIGGSRVAENLWTFQRSSAHEPVQLQSWQQTSRARPKGSKAVAKGIHLCSTAVPHSRNAETGNKDKNWLGLPSEK